MTTHTPATPLPWRVGQVSAGRFPAYPIIGDQLIVADVTIRARGRSNVDAAYIAHAANAYPRLIEALRSLKDRIGAFNGQTACSPEFNAAHALLAELGE